MSSPCRRSDLRLHAVDVAQAALERLGNIDAHAARFLEQLGIDEQVDGSLFDRPVAAHARVHALARAFDLAPRLDEPVRAFSHGMRKKLSFLAAVLLYGGLPVLLRAEPEPCLEIHPDDAAARGITD